MDEKAEITSQEQTLQEASARTRWGVSSTVRDARGLKTDHPALTYSLFSFSRNPDSWCMVLEGHLDASERCGLALDDVLRHKEM